MTKNIIITIDGPAGSGKSTSAKLVAEKLGYTYLDTGAMYRAITYLALKNNVLNDKAEIIKIADKARITFENSDGSQRVFVNDEEVTAQIRSFEVNSNVSEVSVIPEVRESLVRMQRQIGREIDVVAEGRDTGTVVFPDADVKFFLVASIRERAQRRMKEFEAKGQHKTLGEIQDNIMHRDMIDSGREVSPLRKAEDAIEIDTSDITIEEQVAAIIRKVEERLKEKSSQF